jgi:hypothetical protein
MIYSDLSSPLYAWVKFREICFGENPAPIKSALWVVKDMA